MSRRLESSFGLMVWLAVCNLSRAPSRPRAVLRLALAGRLFHSVPVYTPRARPI